jgi:hypothetical protein
MSHAGLQVPVVLFIFNRPANTGRVMNAIRKAQPAQFFVVGDGPRPNRPGDSQFCEEARQIATRVDWPCDVKTRFRDDNVGCDRSIVDGLDWAFSCVTNAIILEDDCLPDESFFPYCAELLDRYHDQPDVAMISGFNGVAENKVPPESYYFGFVGSSWGWATWSDRWQKLDRRLEDWPSRRASSLGSFLRRTWDRKYYTARFDECMQSPETSPWDYRWFYSRLYFGGLAAIPRVNLISNIGFGGDATHTVNEEPYPLPALRHLAFPLKHPATIRRNQAMDELTLNRLRYPLHHLVALKIRKLLSSWRER